MKDAIDLSTVTILNSPDVRDWPATAEITRIECTPKNTRFWFTKQGGPDAWPAQPFGDPKDAGNCQYTVWLFLQIAGQWFGAGFIECWIGRDGVGDAVSDYSTNWLLAGRGWEPMAGHSIAVGETIGFMVSAGDARLNHTSSVRERSNIVTIAAPAGDVGEFTFATSPQPQPSPAPAPVPPGPQPAPVPPDPVWAPAPATAIELLERVLPLLDEIVTSLDTNSAAAKELAERLAQIEERGIKVTWS